MGEAVHKSTLARKSNGELAEAASVGAHTQPEIGVRHSARKSADSGSHTLPKIDGYADSTAKKGPPSCYEVQNRVSVLRILRNGARHTRRQ
jgi:hypothetical protein